MEIDFLHPSDIKGAMTARQANVMVIGGKVDLRKKTVTVIRASDLKKFVIPFSKFKPSGNGTKPNFGNFRIVDCGFGIRFGSYEASSDSILPGVRR